jgi:beta-glucanase (GH16 family)
MHPALLRPALRLGATLATLAAFAATPVSAATSNLLDLNFNTAGSYAGWGSTGLLATGNPLNGTSAITTILPGSTGYNSGLFPTAPTSGYIALTPNASAVSLIPGNVNYYWGGWAGVVTLPVVNSPYTAGGMGQTDASKISFTARVRAVGMTPTTGSVVILRLAANGDNPGNPTAGYKRIQFEPVFLAGNDWTTIGGTLDTAGLTAAKGSIYAFPLNAQQYTPSLEVSGFNRFGVSGYVAYNTPTGVSNGGRKNPGFGLTSGIRVEIDDVKLVVTDPATTGYIAATTPAQLLRNGNFNTGDANWTFFEGAYASTEGYSEDGSIFAYIPGWGGSPYAGFMQNGVLVNSANGDFFTATFRAKFETNYKADRTLVAFMDGGGVNTFLEVNIADEIAPRLGQWATYQATFRASAANIAAMNGTMSLKIQPIGRTANGTAFSSAFIDDIVLSQSSTASVGPQIKVLVAGASRADGDTATLFSPVIGKTTPYTVKVENNGGQDLTVSGVSLSGTGFALSTVATPFTLAPGASQSITVTTSPTALGTLTGALTVTSNDKETADQSYLVNLSAAAVTLSDTFDTAATAAELGWFTYASSTLLGTQSTLSAGSGTLVLNVNSTGDDYPWTYIVSKPFASPGSIDLTSSSLVVALKAQGVFGNLTTNKVQVRLESLNASGGITGRIELGAAVDETTTGAAPGAPAYFVGDGTPDRVAVSLPEGGSFSTVGGTLASTGVNTTFDADAPQFRLVIQMTDFDFDLDAGNLVTVDSITLNLATKAFTVSDGGFESNATDPGTPAAPTGWLQFPADGVNKNVVANGTGLYNAALQNVDPVATFAAYSGTKAMKVYGQNYYVGGVWQGPSQTGTVYQSFLPGDTTSLATGTQIHARAAAKVYGIDPLTGGSTFNFGFKFLNASNVEISRAVTTLTAATDTPDQWVALVANGTVPAGTARVDLVSEFIQNAATDGGSVYLDDVSVGLGYVAPSVTVGTTTYALAWSDEFDGNALNTANWTAELGRGPNNDGWGNGEAQTYTDSPDNLRVSGGSLVIEARKTGSDWTSARIKTQAKRSFKYGKIEFRAKLPSGVGPWPAAWMMGENISTVGWPACGEIDVMEWRGTGSDANSVGHATHSPSRFGGNPIEARVPVSDLSTQFHTFAVLWEPNRVTFSVDGLTTATWTTADTGSPFENDFFLLLNMAIGGAYLGGQIDSGLTSALYEVDYVRVYQAPALNAYQTYLQSVGLATDLAFDADGNGDGVAEGVMYSFGASSPRLGASAPTLTSSGNTLTYTFDLRDDSALTLTPQVSTDLATWTTAPNYTLTDGTGAASGFVRKVLAVTSASAPRIFVRLRVGR